MLFQDTLTVFAILFVATDCKSNLEAGNACVVRFLKDRKQLRDDFPVSTDLDTSRCRLVMPLIMHVFEKALCSKLSEEKSINAECVMSEFKSSGVMDLMLKQEVVLMSKDLPEDESKKMLEEGKNELRRIFHSASNVCESNPTYAGLFDDILEFKNESLAVLRQDYCFTKYVVESKLIDTQDIDINPKRIVTTNIDCQAMIKSNQIERQEKLVKSLKSKNLTSEQIQCVIDKFQIERAFDSNLALEVIDQVDVPLEVRRRNRENIAKKLENFIKSVFICAGNLSDRRPFTNQVSIMQF